VRKRLLFLIVMVGLYIGLMLPALAAAPPDPNAAATDSLASPAAVRSVDVERPPVPLRKTRTAARLLSGRALWVKRDQLVSPERIIRVVDEAADNGYTVLFVQVRGRGDAWYESAIVPKAHQLRRTRNGDASFDPLAFLLERAHARKLEVHAWVNAFLIWSGDSSPMLAGHVLNTNPDWTAIDSKGRRLADYTAAELKRANIEGVFLAAGNPEVRDHLRRVIAEIAVNYAVDGIHLDYIRCPLVDAGYDPASRAAFMAQEGVDPWKLRHAVPGLEARFGRAAVAALEKRWQAWRAEQVTKLVKAVRFDLDQLDRPVILSAAVFPNVKTAPINVGQDWLTWAREGYVDMLVPMFYSPKTDVVLHQLEMAQRDLPADVILYAGISVYNQPLASAAQKAIKVRQAGAHGVSFFPYDTLAERPGTLRQLTRMSFGGAGGSAGSAHSGPVR
jgi:uncharacterized lipoprotein YddW (UPF0748 family)